MVIHISIFFLVLFFDESSGQQVGVSSRYRYICGSDPFKFYSEFPCNLYPICINGGFNIRVGCQQDYQCTPYSSDAVCVNNCCCTVPRIVSADTTTRRFYDNSSRFSTNVFLITTFFLFLNFLM